jgi:hypothetical protein
MTSTPAAPVLADHPPGAALVVALERGVAGEHLVDVLRAEHRQLAHQQARVLRAMSIIISAA